MGLGIILLFGGAAGIVFASVASAFLHQRVERLTRDAGAGRAEVLRAATLLPIGSIFWAGLVFALQGWVNSAYLHRDIGIGDWFECPLSNGYGLVFADTTDIGDLYSTLVPVRNPRVTEIQNVRMMQIAGKYILGGADSHPFEHFGKPGKWTDWYFLLDTQSGIHEDFGSLEDLRNASEARNIPVKLEPIGNLYTRYRWTWFDLLAVLVMVVPPVCAYLGLMHRVDQIGAPLVSQS